MKKINISVSKVRKEIFKIADIIQKKSIYFLITRYDKPSSVIISFKEFENYKKLLHLSI